MCAVFVTLLINDRDDDRQGRQKIVIDWRLPLTSGKLQHDNILSVFAHIPHVPSIDDCCIIDMLMLFTSAFASGLAYAVALVATIRWCWCTFTVARDVVDGSD